MIYGYEHEHSTWTHTQGVWHGIPQIVLGHIHGVFDMASLKYLDTKT